MIIICSKCKKQIGEQKPYQDTSKIKAKCSSCIAKEKEAQLKYRLEHPLVDLNKSREVNLEYGLKGILSVAGKETEKLSFWELLVAGKKVFCAKPAKEEFMKFLESLSQKEVDVTFIHSGECKFDKTKRGSKNKNLSDNTKEKKEPDIYYNCTVRVAKDLAPLMFDSKEQSFQEFVKLLGEIAQRQEMEKQPSPA